MKLSRVVDDQFVKKAPAPIDHIPSTQELADEQSGPNFGAWFLSLILCYLVVFVGWGLWSQAHSHPNVKVFDPTTGFVHTEVQE